MSEQDNYISPSGLVLFLDAIPKLSCYYGNFQKPPLAAFQLQLLFKLCYYCALRISEALNLEKRDFDLEHKTLRIRNAKTGKGKTQKTSIAPPIIKDLKSYFSLHSVDQLFKCSRQTAWKYAKEAGEIAGLKIYDELEERSIAGVYTHIFRKSYAKFMENEGANPSLIMIKGRWKPSAMYQTYTKPSIMTLIAWEDKIFNGV